MRSFAFARPLTSAAPQQSDSDSDVLCRPQAESPLLIALESAYRAHEAACGLLEADALQLLQQLRDRLAALRTRGTALSELQRHLLRTRQQLLSASAGGGHALQLAPEQRAVRLLAH